jgi:adenine-specific DNA-methyltransferase
MTRKSNMAEEQIDGKSLNIGEDNTQRLKELFPQVFTEGKVDFNRLKDLLGIEVNANQEYYALNWANKSEARREIQKQTTATLIPERDKSIDFDSSKNLFIEGENLEVLRVLQKSYFGKVKMVYIDPPYNTGSDSFIYPDDYSERQEEYQKRTGITDEEGFLNKQDLWRKNTKESGQFHSAWLSMMYPRLYLARNLMREDGVIFVSIDDNEQSNLKLLMDEIFGEENLICNFTREAIKGGSQSKFVRITHDYLLAYAKNKEELNFSGFEKEEIVLNLKDDKGLYAKGRELNKWGAGSRREDSPSMWYPIPGPNGEEVYPIRNDGSEGRWRLGKVKMGLLLADGDAIFEKRPDGTYIAYEKLRGNKTDIKQFISILKDKYLNAKATEDLKELFGAERAIFDFSKPSIFLKDLMILADTGNSDIILDFFAGSGSLAQAVMELNKEDGESRQFICIQVPELVEEGSEAYKAGYKTISDLCRSRITKRIEKFLLEAKTTLKLSKEKYDWGFQSYKLAPSNFKQWRADIEGQEILKQLELHIDASKENTGLESMLRELLLKVGKHLTAQMETVETAEGSFFYVPENRYVFCLNGYGDDTQSKILALNPYQIFVLDKFFEKDETLSNARNTIRDAGIEKFTVI